MKPIGLYIHIPFCESKCPYCDFYSRRGSDAQMDSYVDAVAASVRKWGSTLRREADTLYFGGGTPSLLGAERLLKMVSVAKESFGLADAEITVEVNPQACSRSFFNKLYNGGVNRLSVGLQSARDEELKLLGRRHTAAQALDSVLAAQDAGFDNISLDLMLATQGQTEQSLAFSVEFCEKAGVQHISAYLLKIEPDTVYGKKPEQLFLPDEDTARGLYLSACKLLENAGFAQYEISNFAKPGRESRHNLKYWNDEEYLGVGPAAHSMVDGKRFFYPRSIERFIAGEAPQDDGTGGGEEEYAMLRLRLRDGLDGALYFQRFQAEIPQIYYKNAARFSSAGFCECGPHGIRLTQSGFLVSNYLISEILYRS